MIITKKTTKSFLWRLMIPGWILEKINLNLHMQGNPRLFDNKIMTDEYYRLEFENVNVFERSIKLKLVLSDGSIETVQVTLP